MPLDRKPELAFFTNQELIDELINRKNFVGIIIFPREEVKDASTFWNSTAKFTALRKNMPDRVVQPLMDFARKGLVPE